MSLRLVAIGGSLLYVATLAVVPLANLDRDVLRLHPEDLVDAKGGFLVVVGWLVFAVALLAVALIAWRARGARAKVAALCFAVAAFVSLANAVDPTLGVRASPLELGIFGLAIGPLVASVGAGRRALTVVALLTAAFFLGIVFEAAAIGGVMNRLFDGSAALWCILFALRLRSAGVGE